MTLRWTFPRPESYHLGSTLSCLSMVGRDPSLQALPGGGRRKLFWLGEELCRLTVGGDAERLRVEVEGADRLEEADLAALLALNDEPSLRLAPDDPLRRLPRKVRELRLGRVFWLYEAVFQTALHQRVSTAEACANWNRLCYRYGERWDGLVSAPSPARVLGLSAAQFAACGVEQKRMVPIKEAAFRLRTLPRPHPADLFTRLTACRGIGTWTAESVRGHFLGYADAVPLGDYNFPNWVAHFFRGERRGDDAQMLELLAPYAGQRYRVLRWLAAAGAIPPRRGARLPLGTL